MQRVTAEPPAGASTPVSVSQELSTAWRLWGTGPPTTPKSRGGFSDTELARSSAEIPEEEPHVAAKPWSERSRASRQQMAGALPQLASSSAVAQVEASAGAHHATDSPALLQNLPYLCDGAGKRPLLTLQEQWSGPRLRGPLQLQGCVTEPHSQRGSALSWGPSPAVAAMAAVGLGRLGGEPKPGLSTDQCKATCVCRGVFPQAEEKNRGGQMVYRAAGTGPSVPPHSEARG